MEYIMPATARKYPDLIAQLKLVKQQSELTNQQIFEMAQAQHEAPAPSLRTIQSVFSDGSEDKAFVYDATLKALVIVLVRDRKAKSEADALSIDTLKILLDEKNARISMLLAEIDRLREIADEVPLLQQQLQQANAAKEYVKREHEADQQQIITMQAQMNQILEILSKK